MRKKSARCKMQQWYNDATKNISSLDDDKLVDRYLYFRGRQQNTSRTSVPVKVINMIIIGILAYLANIDLIDWSTQLGMTVISAIIFDYIEEIIVQKKQLEFFYYEKVVEKYKTEIDARSIIL